MREATLAAQRGVVEAIEAKDPSAAEAATRALVDLAAEEVGRAFSLERTSAPPAPPLPAIDGQREPTRARALEQSVDDRLRR